MMKLAVIPIVLASLSVAIALAQERAYTPDPAWVPPPEALTHKNPLAGNTAVVGGGRKLYLRNCAECHGEQGLGRRNAPNLRLPVVQEQSDGALFWKITNGNSGRDMPAWSRLPEAQRWQLVLFLRTLPQDSGR